MISGTETPGAQESIRKRLVKASFLTIVAVLAMATGILVVGEYSHGRSGLLEEIETQANMLATQSSAPLVFGDYAAANEILGALTASRAVTQATLFLPDKQPFASFYRDGKTVAWVEHPGGDGHAFTQEHIDIFRVVSHAGQQAGLLHVRASLWPLYHALVGYAASMLPLLLLALGAGYMLMNRLQRTITEPLIQLTALSQHISEIGDYGARATVTSRDEIGTLAENLNHMLDQIQNREAELARELIERERAEQRLDLIAHYDTITGLPNRYFFNEQLAKAFKEAMEHNKKLALLFIDLDNFKDVNDTLGHQAGDDLLRVVTQRLQGALRAGDMLCRVGGDEFAVILEDITDPIHVESVAAKCIKSTAGAIEVQGSEIYITVSIGIGICPEDGEDVHDLLKSADTAMYHAKGSGKNAYQRFLPEMRTRTQKRIRMESHLRRAIEKNEFLLHYQPQVDLNTGSIVGVEALIRWANENLGIVSPAEFIPIAEENGLIVPIGEWVLRTACIQAKAWSDDQRVGPVRVAVNLSGRQFREANLVKRVEAIVGETGLDPNLLEIELTESTLMDVDAVTVSKLEQLRAIGIHLSIDDFGTGYSSMSYLKRFPINTLKIDRSFVKDIPGDEEDAAITIAIIAMARSLKMDVIAEGVETAEQANFLATAGCGMSQGYYFARPMAYEAVTRFMIRNTPDQGGGRERLWRPANVSQPEALRAKRM